LIDLPFTRTSPRSVSILAIVWAHAGSGSSAPAASAAEPERKPRRRSAAPRYGVSDLMVIVVVPDGVALTA